MLDARRFDALPILADALQDGGCDDERSLSQCQEAAASPIDFERLVNIVFSEKTEAAVRWLEQFAKDIGYEDEDHVEPPTYTYERIVEIGRYGVEEGYMGFWTDAGADFFRDSDEDAREFFRNWSLVTGVAVSDEKVSQIAVSCAC